MQSKGSTGAGGIDAVGGSVYVEAPALLYSMATDASTAGGHREDVDPIRTCPWTGSSPLGYALDISAGRLIFMGLKEFEVITVDWQDWSAPSGGAAEGQWDGEEVHASDGYMRRAARLARDVHMDITEQGMAAAARYPSRSFVVDLDEE